MLALRALVGGFENVGVVAFRKDLDFAKEFRFNVYKKLLSFALTVTFAVVLRNYWALVVGIVSYPFFAVLLSYRMHPYRPRFAVSKIREIWSFALAMWLYNFGYYLNRKTDQFVVGGFVGTAPMGRYFMAAEIATSPTVEIVLPLGRALFPGYAKLTHDPERFAATVLSVFGLTTILCLSVGFGVAAVAEDFVVVVLGEKWLPIVPLMRWLALYGAAAGLSSTVALVLLVSGKEYLAVLEAWTQFIVLVIVFALIVQVGDVYAIAVARTCIAILFVPVLLYLITLACRVSLTQLAGTVWRPLVASVTMFLMVRLLHGEAIQTPIARLGLDILSGVATFAISMLLLWYLAGRPHGPERMMYFFIANSLVRRFKKKG